MSPPLFEHQIKSIEFLGARTRGLDASDPGVGKTRVQIELFSERRKRGGKCALVLAPKSLLYSAWYDDIKAYQPWLRVSVAKASNREKAFAEEADIYVTNTDAARWLAKQKKSFFDRFDTLIIDEASYFKHHTSQRSRAVNKIKKYFEYRYGLTGTPNANGITDIWNPVFILDDGKSLGSSFYQFRGSVCTPIQVGPATNMVKWEDKPGIEVVVAGLIKDLVIRHKFEECLSIPENHQYVINYHPSDAQRAAYRDMEHLALTMLSSGEIISAVNAASVATKLLQISSGAVYQESGDYSLIDTGRYELVADLIEERARCVVFFNWRHQRDELIKEFKKRGLTHVLIDGTVSDKHRLEAVHHFQSGFYRIILVHPASAAHGLTLTSGTSTIWTSPTYNLEHFLQGNRRIYRAGQSKRTETLCVLTKDGIEQEVYRALTEKDAKQVSLLKVLKDMQCSSQKS